MGVTQVIKYVQDGTFVKRVLWKIYSVFIKPIIKAFVWLLPIKGHTVVFDNFMGEGYTDNPAVLAEEIHKQMPTWRLVWLVKDVKNTIVPQYVIKVRYGSPKALYELATAGIWIDNVRNADKLYKKKGQIYLQAWHGGGLPLKLIEGQVEHKLAKNYVKCAKNDGRIMDAILSPNKVISALYREYFWLGKDVQVLEYGSPRNDCLLVNKDNEEYITELRKKLGVGNDEYVILYAPTFRDDFSVDGYKIDFVSVLDAMEAVLHKKVKIVVRLHPNTEDDSFINYREGIINGSCIESIQDMVLMSDMLITDYSSTFYDFLLLRKPVLLCTFDLEQYTKKRGLTSIFYELPFYRADSNEELLKIISMFDQDEYQKRVLRYCRENGICDTDYAAPRAVEWLIARSFK